jgi:hypothetical protein
VAELGDGKNPAAERAVSLTRNGFLGKSKLCTTGDNFHIRISGLAQGNEKMSRAPQVGKPVALSKVERFFTCSVPDVPGPFLAPALSSGQECPGYRPKLSPDGVMTWLVLPSMKVTKMSTRPLASMTG